MYFPKTIKIKINYIKKILYDFFLTTIEIYTCIICCCLLIEFEWMDGQWPRAPFDRMVGITLEKMHTIRHTQNIGIEQPERAI